MSTKLDFKDMNRCIDTNLKGAEKVIQDIKSLIDETKAYFSTATIDNGGWEELELHQAHILLEAGFPQLAIISVGKAIAISSLSPEEYTFGFTIVQKQTHAISDMEILRVSAKGVQKDTAKSLRASEDIVAVYLEKVQEETAKKLLDEQANAASKLEQKNQDDAYELLLIEEKAMDSLQEGEKKIVAHMHALEQTLSWMAGSYTNEYMPSGSVFDDIYRDIQSAQKETAIVLKQHQTKIASDLQKHQIHLAASLEELQSGDAVHLKEDQQDIAKHLKEDQEIKAIKKLREDKDSAS